MAALFDRLAVANRGEVAVRIIRACQELGIKSILLHSEADVKTVAYRLADETVCIGGASLEDSYLNVDNNLRGALAAGADALHPGFGFLSENPDFARACEKNRIVFVGPSSETIRQFGNKISAKQLAQARGVPLIPGYQGADQRLETLIQEADKIGYPVIVKVAGGGGGRGLKVARSSEDIRSAIESARREGLAAFGSDVVFLEKYLDRAKHIEVQIFGDASGKAHHLFDRECSVQRRHQKIVEEALSPSLDDNLRRDVTESARALAEGSSYRSAGTVEFLLQDGKFYFMEMNTRLQVEHPVTEMVVGVDLVKSQIITAAGRPVSFDRRPVQARGHAIECRLYAEDAYNKSLPSTGELALVDLPHGPGRRFDVGFEVGDVITPFFDPMIGKLIVWDETRPRAIQKMLRVIHDTIVFGVRTNLPFLREILRHPEFLEGTMDTRFVEKFFPDGVTHRPSYADSDMLFEIVDRELSMPSDSNGRKMDPWGHRWGRS